MTSTEGATTATTLTGERADLLATLRLHRNFLRFTVRGLTDDQARQRTTVSELTLGGLIKHVAHTEQNWVAFARGGPGALTGTPEGGPLGGEATEDDYAAFQNSFLLRPGETLQGVLDFYQQVAADTEVLLAAEPELDLAYPLPEAPWFEPGAHWSIRRVLLHLVAETSQHAGHADILRESLDGQKTMG